MENAARLAAGQALRMLSSTLHEKPRLRADLPGVMQRAGAFPRLPPGAWRCGSRQPTFGCICPRERPVSRFRSPALRCPAPASPLSLKNSHSHSIYYSNEFSQLSPLQKNFTFERIFSRGIES